jgi:hypothetical protein
VKQGAKLLNVGLLALICVVLLWLGVSEFRHGAYVAGCLVVVLFVVLAAAACRLFVRYWRA